MAAVAWSAARHSRLIDSRSIPLRNAIAQWLARYGAAIARQELARLVVKADPFAGLIDQLARLLIFYGSRMANAAGQRVAGKGWELPPVFLDEFVKQKTVLVQGIAKETREGVRDSIRTLVREGLAEIPTPSAGEIARRIRSTYLGEVDKPPFLVSSERAALIARTELAQDQNTGIFAGYVEIGAKRKVWSAYSDGRSGDRHHELMDGKSVPLGEDFVTPLGNRLRYPGDPAAPIKETANCRCTITAEV